MPGWAKTLRAEDVPRSGARRIIHWINARNKLTGIPMHPFGDKASSFPRRFAALFYGSLFLVLFAATLLFFIEEAGVKAVILPPAGARKVLRGYFRNGQWRADARTLVAAARWCFEPSSVFPSSPANLPTLPTLGTNTPPISRT